MSKKYHHWRWRSPKYLLLCGASDGLIDRHDETNITCKNCIRIMNAKGGSFLRPKKEEGPVCDYCNEHDESTHMRLDPFALEINNEEREVFWCDSCTSNRAGDI